MALRWLEGFETRQSSTYLGRLYTFAGGGSLTFPTGRRHGTAMRGTNNQITTPAMVSMNENVWIVHFAFQKSSATALSTSEPGVVILDSVGSQLQLRIVDAASPDTGGFQVALKRGSTTLATSPVYAWGATPRAWHVFQLKVTIDPTVGTYELRHYDYDGTETTSIAAATNQNTANQGTAGADRMTFLTGSAGSSLCLLDDIVVLDGSGGSLDDFFAAPVVVVGELPNAEGTTNDFLPSSGSDNSALVDDAPTLPDETTEVSSSDVGEVDLYQFSQADLDLLPTSSPPDVHGIMVDVEAEIKNSGTANLRVEVRDGMDQATDTKDLDYTGAIKVSRFTVLQENPTGTPAPWTVADLNTVEIGVKYDS